MTADKAIRILREIAGSSSPYFIQDDRDALELGIRALLQISQSRRFNFPVYCDLLQGETKEVHEIREHESTNTQED